MQCPVVDNANTASSPFLLSLQPTVGFSLPPHLRFSRSHTVGRTPLDEWSAPRRDLYLTTQHLQQTNIHATGGIQTRNPCKRSAVDTRLRQLGHWDRR
jgi:hypothetical protein